MSEALASVVQAMSDEADRLWAHGERVQRVLVSEGVMRLMNGAMGAGDGRATQLAFPCEPDTACPIDVRDNVDVFALESEKRRGDVCRCGCRGEDGLCDACIRLAKRDGTW